MSVVGRERRALAAAVLALAVLSSSCAFESDRIYGLNVYRPDAPSYLFAGATKSRAVPTYVIGDPFGTNPEVVANVVAAALQTAFPGRGVRFAVREEEGLRDDVAMVIAFDAPKGTSAKALCRAPGRIGFVPSAEAIRALMAFCHANQPLTSIEGRLGRRAGIGDKEFVVLIRDMAKRMFEARHEFKQ